jgi:hypothetical protein
VNKGKKRRPVFACLTVSLVALISFAGCCYSPVINRIDVVLKDLPPEMQGVKVVQLSDLHIKPPYDLYEKVVSLVNAENADIIVITGDLFDHAQYTGETLELIGSLRARHGKYAVFGNWEHWAGADLQEFRNGAAGAGVTILVNQNAPVDLPGGKLWLAGVDDPFTHRDDIDKALEGIPGGRPKILLAHAPNIMKKAREHGMSLVLAGHTHGGQIRLPLIGSVFYLAQPKMLKYSKGMFRKGETQMYVNAGIGVSTIKYRFLCRPEITVITLRGK